MSSIMKGLVDESENVNVIYIDGKPAAKYVNKFEAEKDANRIRTKFPNKRIEIKAEVREAEGDTLLDPEYSLPQARSITKAIKYDDTVGEIITQIQMLAERTEGIDSKTIEYAIDGVLSAKRALESAVYDLEEAFEDAAREAQYKRDEVDENVGIPFRGVGGAFNRGDDERHDLDVPTQKAPQEWGLKINGKVWSKDGKSVTFASKEQALKARQTLLAKRPELEIGLVTRNVSEALDENLKQWFKEKWVRFGPDGKIRGDCARGDDSEGKPKCLPQSKAHSLGKKGRASAASRKRREDPNPERSGKAINVNTKKKSNESINEGIPSDNDMGSTPSGAKMTLGQWKQMWMKKMPNADMSLFRFPPSMSGSAIAYFDGWVNNPDARWDPKQGVAEEELDEACWKGYHKEGNKKMFGKTYPNCVKNEDVVHAETCPHCGGELVSEELMHEKQDACYHKVKSRYKVWPSAYASGALVQCRKKGASNWGNGGKKNESVSLGESDSSDAVYHAVLNRIMRQHLDLLREYGPKIVMYAIEDVANGVGDLDEIGSSDVSIWTKQVIQDLESGQYAHLKETPTNDIEEDTAYAGGMGQGGNAGQSYRKFKPKSAGTFESSIMKGLKCESK